jgi:hypothetical protein
MSKRAAVDRLWRVELLTGRAASEMIAHIVLGPSEGESMIFVTDENRVIVTSPVQAIETVEYCAEVVVRTNHNVYRMRVIS